MNSSKIYIRFILTGILIYLCTGGCNSQSSKQAPIEVSSDLNRIGTLWAPYIEWHITNTTYSGNPFDLVAEVIFSHEQSGNRISTYMFYDNNDVWRWRFTGIEVGTWNYYTVSDDPELNGISGHIDISPNLKGDVYSFVTQYETTDHTKWARYKGVHGNVEVFVPQFVMYRPRLKEIYDKPEVINADINVFFNEHGFNGFHVPNIAGQFFDVYSNEVVKPEYLNPDPRSFEALEMLIQESHANGGLVHLWMWGDPERQWSANDLEGGANGVVDKRLQRYIAARLGPIPGWTMGYGFDLHEWVTEEQLAEWHQFMKEQMGWKHYLGGRSSKQEYNQIFEGFEYSGYEWHKPKYQDYRDHITMRPHKPAFSEDRFRNADVVGQFESKTYTFDQTRLGLWHSLMAGGVANIWGNLKTPSDDPIGYLLDKIKPGRAMFPYDDGSLSYPIVNQIKTYSTFVEGRFLKDMIPCDGSSNGYCLGDSTSHSYILFRENSDSFSFKVPEDENIYKAIFVDARKSYEEIGPCLISWDGDVNNFKLPYTSDWATSITLLSSRADSTIQLCSYAE